MRWCACVNKIQTRATLEMFPVCYCAVETRRPTRADVSTGKIMACCDIGIVACRMGGERAWSLAGTASSQPRSHFTSELHITWKNVSSCSFVLSNTRTWPFLINNFTSALIDMVLRWFPIAFQLYSCLLCFELICILPRRCAPEKVLRLLA